MKNNIIFIKHLQYEIQILFLQEIWCKEKSDVINLIGSDVNFSLHYRPTTCEGIDINNTKKKGRVPGGIGWVINKKVGKHQVIFINDRISILKIGNIAIIGVYFTFS